MVLLDERVGLQKKFFELAQEIVPSLDLAIYDLDYVAGSHTLRLFIYDEKTGTAVLDDCVKVDRAMTPVIDETEWVPETLILEVSSPGVYRALRTKEHFERVIGSNISVTLFSKFEMKTEGDQEQDVSQVKKLLGSKKITVKLNEVSDEGLMLQFNDFQFFLDHEEIKKANLEI